MHICLSKLFGACPICQVVVPCPVHLNNRHKMDLFKVEKLPNRGYGVVALRDIQPGNIHVHRVLPPD
jgi:hypothetical protein